MEKADKNGGLIDELSKLGSEEMRSVILAARRRKLDALWHEQIKKLRTPWVFEAIAWYLSHQRLELLDRVQEMEFASDAIPFLPVVPFIWRACADQLCDLAEGRNFASVNMIFANDIHDRLAQSASPYYVHDVRLGEPIGKAGIKTALANLIQAGRRPLTLAESISLALQHPEWLDQEGLVPGASGSGEDARAGKRSLDLLLTRGCNHPIDVFGLVDGLNPPGARLPSCAYAFDPEKLWCDAT